MKAERTPLPNNLEESRLIAEECEVPEIVKNFVRAIVCGATTFQSENCKRRFDSISPDLLYATRHGGVKTSKHITLGITLKSLTSSRKILDIINRFGHCCSYSVLEELETEATYFSCNTKTLYPAEVVRRPNLFTNVAFDRFIETFTGKDTLHDMVGILIQNKLADDEIVADDETVVDSSDSLFSGPSSKRRRTLEFTERNLTTYLT